MILNIPFTAPDKNNRTYDFSEYDNHGTVENNTFWNSTAGYDGFGAFEFDGVNDYINISDSDSLDDMNELTVAVWVYPKSEDANNKPIVFKRFTYFISSVRTNHETCPSKWVLAVENLTSDVSDVCNEHNNATIELNKWQFIVGTYNGSELRLYKNGSLEAISNLTGKVDDTDNPIIMGSHYDQGSFNGIIDEVKIWNRSLSVHEISLLYNNRTNITHNNATNILGNWSVKATPIDEHGLNGSSVTSNVVPITTAPPSLDSILLNATTTSNMTTDNLTAHPTGATSPQGGSVYLNYNWYNDAVSDTLLNIPSTAPDANNITYDMSGYDTHGTVYNATWNATAGHNGSGAYMFDGGGDVIDFGDVDALQITGDVSFGAWIKIASPSNQDGIITTGRFNNESNMTNVNYLMWLNTASGTDIRYVHEYEEGSNEDHTFNVDLDNNKWYHVFIVRDVSQDIVKLYLNGMQADTPFEYTNDPTNGTVNNLYVGMDVNTYNTFDGVIDDVRIYNRTLTPDEVMLLYGNNTNITHYSATEAGNNWTVKVTPIDDQGINGTGILSNGVNISPNTPPELTSVAINATSASNLSTNNITSYVTGASDDDGDSVQLNYNWYVNGASDAVMNMPFTSPDHDARDYDTGMTYDLTGNENHGTVYNATWNATAGYDGFGAFDFDGSNDYIDIGKDSSLDFVDELTISAWVKFAGANLADLDTIISKGNTLSNDLVFQWIEAGGSNSLRFRLDADGSQNTVDTSNPLEADRWYHLVSVYNGTDIIWYINGTLDASESLTGTIDTADSTLKIGSGGDASDYAVRFFNGTIDEVKVWNRSLSSHEIALLYNNRSNITHNNATAGAENWTVKVTPIDSWGINGTQAWSNDMNVTDMFYSLYNQTPAGMPHQIVNISEPINPNQNLTIRVNATNLGGTISTVWIVIWETVKSAGDIMWQGVMSLVDGLWQIDIPVNESYPNMTNFTVYVNDTQNITYEIDSNFSVNAPPTITSVALNLTSDLNHTSDNLTAYPTGQTDPNGHSVKLNYNWYRDGVTDTILNMPMTAPDRNNYTYDTSGLDNNGHVMNAKWNKTAGHDGLGAFEFNEDGVINISSPNEFPTSEGTISLWAKFGKWDGYDNIIDMRNGDENSNRITFERNDGLGICSNPSDNAIHFVIFNAAVDDYSAVCPDTEFQTGSWYHIVGTWNSTTISVYVNGTLDRNETASGLPESPANDVLIGGTATWANRLFNGTIDDVRIYNRSISAHEVALLYNNITNITHNNATSGADNWTVKITPIDEYGLNGSAVWSNDVNITKMVLSVYNQTPTNLPHITVNDTAPINPYQNLTIKINATNLGGSISTVWIVIWQTIKSAGDILWQGIATLVGDFYEVEIPVNYSYPEGQVNYTIFANDSDNVTTELEGNFSVNQAPTLTSLMLNATTKGNKTIDNLTAHPTGASDPDEDSIQINYNWIINETSDTVLNMPFTSPDKNNQTYDFSGYDNHGNVTNATWNKTAGYDGFGAFEFDGNGHISAGKVLENNISFTITAWIKKKGDWNIEEFVASQYRYYTATNQSGFFLGNFYEHTFYVFGEENTTGILKNCKIEASEPSSEEWHHIAGTFKTGEIKYYVDGIDTGTPIGDCNFNLTMDPSFALEIGRRSNDPINTWHFNGTIDEVKIYNRSLSANEIALLYNNRTNITHNNATSGAENWTVKATPIDEWGLNGTSVWSNSVNITDMSLELYNQTPTNIPYITVNDTEPVNPYQNLTTRINTTNVGETVNTVWIVIWETVKSSGDVLWQGVTNLVDLYEITVPVNYSYPGGVVNYTIYANDSYNVTTELEGNFSVNQAPAISFVILNATTIWSLSPHLTRIM